MDSEFKELIIRSTRRALDDYLSLFERRSDTKWYTRGDLREIIYEIKNLPEIEERIAYKKRFKEIINRSNSY